MRRIRFALLFLCALQTAYLLAQPSDHRPDPAPFPIAPPWLSGTAGPMPIPPSSRSVLPATSPAGIPRPAEATSSAGAWLGEWASGSLRGTVRFADAATLPDGGVVVTGRSDSLGRSADLLVAAFAPDGVRRWVTRYDGGAGGWDEGVAVAVTPGGDIAVCGTSVGVAGDPDLLTLLLDGDGAIRWERRWSRAAGSSERAAGVAVDRLGQVWACGTTLDPDRGEDWVVLRHGRTGERLSVSVIDHAGGRDRPAAMAVAGETAYVAGTVYRSGFRDDAAVVAFDPAGRRLWTAVLPDSGRAAETPVALAVEAGGVWLAGNRMMPDGRAIIFLAGVSVAGAVEWIRSVGGAGGGDAVVTGVAAGENPQGVWLSGYGQDDAGRFAALAAAYNCEGERLWLHRHRPRDVADAFALDVVPDAGGGAWVATWLPTGVETARMGLLQYDVRGRLRGLYRHEGPAQYALPSVLTSRGDGCWLVGSEQRAGVTMDGVVARAVDGAGFRATGGYRGARSSLDLLTDAIALPGGTTAFVGHGYREGEGWAIQVTGGREMDPASLWTRRYADPDPADRVAVAAAPLGSGLAVLGERTGPRGRDWILLALRGDGSPIWERTFDGPDGLNDQAVAVAADPAGGLYAAGVIGRPGRDSNWAVSAWGGDGTLRWVRYLDGPGGAIDRPIAIVADREGPVACGVVETAGGGYDIVVVRYDRDGRERWRRTISSGTDRWDWATALALNGDRLHVSGFSYTPAGEKDAVVYTWDRDGRLLWSGLYSGGAGMDAHPAALAVLADGALAVSGWRSGADRLEDIWTAVYERDGRLRWRRELDGPAAHGDRPVGLVADGDGVVMGGWSYGDAGRSDYLMVAWDGAGVERWRERWAARPGWDFVPESVLARDHSVMLAGSRVGVGDGDAWATVTWLVRPRFPATAVADEAEPAAGGAARMSAYPNPVNGAAVLRVDLPRSGHWSLTIVDVLGREVRRLHAGFAPAGRHTWPWRSEGLSSGRYFAVLQGPRGRRVHPLTLVR